MTGMSDLLDDGIEPKTARGRYPRSVLFWLSIVFFIAGVIFKIQHWPSADLLILVGLTGIILDLVKGAFKQ